MRLFDPNDTYSKATPKLKLPPGGALSAPTTAASGVTANAPIPGVDPFRLAQANDAYARAVASVGSRRGSTMSQYGFKATGYDDSGNPQGLEVDPMSQFGAYQQLLDRQAGESMDAENAGAGRGFTGGLANQAEGRLRYTQGADRLSLGSGLLSSLGSLNQELLGAKTGYDDELWQARLDAARSAADNNDWTPYATTPDDPASNSSTPPVTIPKGSAPPKKNTPAKAAVLARKVTANKTGATYVKGRGVISIH